MRLDYRKPCGCFSYDTNEGMRAFCIVEMFLALFNLIVALSKIPVVDHLFAGYYYESEKEDYDYLAEKAWAGFTLMFIITLIVQCILAFFLYFLGWKKKNWIVCLVWVIIAGVNVLFSLILLIFYLADKEGLGSGWDYYLLYLLYPVYGIWIVIDFILKEIGRIGRSNPNKGPSSARPAAVKPIKQDVEK